MALAWIYLGESGGGCLCGASLVKAERALGIREFDLEVQCQDGCTIRGSAADGSDVSTADTSASGPDMSDVDSACALEDSATLLDVVAYEEVSLCVDEPDGDYNQYAHRWETEGDSGSGFGTTGSQAYEEVCPLNPGSATTTVKRIRAERQKIGVVHLGSLSVVVLFLSSNVSELVWLL